MEARNSPECSSSDQANGGVPVGSSLFVTIDSKETVSKPTTDAETALDLLEESEDLASYSSYNPGPDIIGRVGSAKHKAGEIDELHVPNQRWELFWEETGNKIHNEEVCGSRLNPKLTITVDSPEVVSSLMSKHVVYSVKSMPLGYSVRRRYNDFAWLRETLSARYEGLYIPAIPSTTAFSSKRSGVQGKKTDVQGDFVKNRMHQLLLFMQQLCNIPFMRTDPAFILFISISNEKEFKQVVEAPVSVQDVAPGTSEQKNEGLRLWHNLIDNAVVNPVEAEKIIMDFKRQVETMRKVLDQVDNECRKLGRTAVQFARGMSSFTDTVAKWTTQEQELLSPEQNRCVNSRSEEVKSTMDAFLYGQSHWSHGIMLMPKILAWIIMSNVQYQLVQVGGFLVHLLSREQLLKELEKAERDRVKALDEKHRAISPVRKSSNIFTKGVGELEESLQKKTELANRLQIAADRTTKALIFCELDRFNKERLKRINDLVSALAATHMQMAQSVTTRWSEIASSLGLDTARFDDIASGFSSTLDNDIFEES